MEIVEPLPLRRVNSDPMPWAEQEEPHLAGRAEVDIEEEEEEEEVEGFDLFGDAAEGEDIAKVEEVNKVEEDEDQYFDIFADDFGAVDIAEEYRRQKIEEEVREKSFFFEDLEGWKAEDLSLLLPKEKDEEYKDEEVRNKLGEKMGLKRKPKMETARAVDILDHCSLCAYCLEADEKNDIALLHMDVCGHKICAMCLEGWILNDCVKKSVQGGEEQAWNGEVVCPACPKKRVIDFAEMKRYEKCGVMKEGTLEKFTTKLIEETLSIATLGAVRCPKQLQDGSFCNFPVIIESNTKRHRVACAGCKDRSEDFTFCSQCKAHITCHWELQHHECSAPTVELDIGIMLCPHCDTILVKEEDHTLARISEALGVERGNGACNKLTCSKCQKCCCWICFDKSNGYDHFHEKESVCNLWDMVIDCKGAEFNVKKDTTDYLYCRHSSWPTGITHYVTFDEATGDVLTFDCKSKPIDISCLPQPLHFNSSTKVPQPQATVPIVDVNSEKGVVERIRGPRGIMTHEQVFTTADFFCVLHKFSSFDGIFKYTMNGGKDFLLFDLTRSDDGKWAGQWKQGKRRVKSVKEEVQTSLLEAGWKVNEELEIFEREAMEVDAKAPVVIRINASLLFEVRMCGTSYITDNWNVNKEVMAEYVSEVEKSLAGGEKQDRGEVLERLKAIRESFCGVEFLFDDEVHPIVHAVLEGFEKCVMVRNFPLSVNSKVGHICRKDGNTVKVLTEGPTSKEVKISYHTTINHSRMLQELTNTAKLIEACVEGDGKVDEEEQRRREREREERRRQELAAERRRRQEENRIRAEENRRRERERREAERQRRLKREKNKARREVAEERGDPEEYFGNLFDEEEMAAVAEQRERERRAAEEEVDERLDEYFENLFDDEEVAAVAEQREREVDERLEEYFENLFDDEKNGAVVGAVQQVEAKNVREEEEEGEEDMFDLFE